MKHLSGALFELLAARQISVSPVAGVVTLDFTKAGNYLVTLNANVTSIVLSANAESGYTQRCAVTFIQDGTGGRTVTGWPGTISWLGGITPVIDPDANARDVIIIETSNAGTSYNGFLAASNNIAGRKLRALAALDWSEGGIPVFTGAETVELGANREKLIADRSFYVATTGSDVTGDGSVGAPWATAQFAVDWIVNNIDSSGYVITLNLGTGAFGRIIVNQPNGVHHPQEFYIKGNGPANTTASFLIRWTAKARIEDIKLIHVDGVPLVSGEHAEVEIGPNVEIAGNGWTQLYAYDYGRIRVEADYSITSGAGAHVYVTEFGSYGVGAGLTITLTGTPAFTDAFAVAEHAGFINFEGMTFSGSATGQRFKRVRAGKVSANNTLPGSLGGRTRLDEEWHVLAASGVAVSHTGDTLATTLATITIPGGAMGPNGILKVTTVWTYPNNANLKGLRVVLGGTSGVNFLEINPTATVAASTVRFIHNRNSQSSQIGSQAAGNANSYATTTGALQTSAINTAVDQDLLLRAICTVASDTITLESYVVEVCYRP